VDLTRGKLIFLILSAFAVVSCGRFWGSVSRFGGGSGGNSGDSGNICTSQEITGWIHVDRGAGGGINIVPASSAFTPFPIVFNSKLYALWIEAAPVRAALYNGNDLAPSWAAEDTGGLNHDNLKAVANPTAAVFNSQLFATWLEKDAVNVYQVRAGVYNGNDALPNWSRIDGDGAEGINAITANQATTTAYPILTSFNSKLYAAWTETDGTNQIRVAVWNGVSVFTSVTGSANGINVLPANQAHQPTLAVYNSKLYASWVEGGAGVFYVRVAVYNGNDGAPSWSFVDGGGPTGLNLSGAGVSAENPKFTVFNSKLYLGWDEAAAPFVIHFNVYNGQDGSPLWTQVDTIAAGSNFDISKNAQFVDLATFNCKLYGTWQESDGAGVKQIRIAVYNGNDASPNWSFVDGSGLEGINFDNTVNANIPFIRSYNSKLYDVWQEQDAGPTQSRASVGLQ
jgi:hypothetical protein